MENSYPGVWNKLKKTKNSASGAKESAKYWCIKFERPANKEQRAIERGNSAANTYWSKYQNNTVKTKTEDNLIYPTKKVKFSKGTKNNAGCVHDISVGKRTPIYAIADGKITCSQKYAIINGKKKLVSYGNVIKFVSSDKTVKATYAHLDSFAKYNLSIPSNSTARYGISDLNKLKISLKNKSIGKSYSVSQGDIIGYTGSAGNSTGPHLHFELYVRGKRVNSPKYLSTSKDDDVEETKYKKSNVYATPLKCYTISKKHVTTYYGSINSNNTGWIDGNKDECTIKEFYTNGYAKVVYSGVNGFAFVPINSLINNSVSVYNTKVSSKQTIYKRSDLKESYGSVGANTKIQVVGKKGNSLQIIVSSDKKYKMAWIDKSKLQKKKTDDMITVNTSNLKTPIKTYTIKKEQIPMETR